MLTLTNIIIGEEHREKEQVACEQATPRGPIVNRMMMMIWNIQGQNVFKEYI